MINSKIKHSITNDEIPALFKIIIIGDSGVGKSCILARLISNEFRNEHSVTIGVEFGNYAMTMNGKHLVKL